MAHAWLPADFAHPTRVELPTGHHLRPIRENDVGIDYPAVMDRASGCGRSSGEPGAGRRRP